jgi:hypothetical protein
VNPWWLGLDPAQATIACGEYAHRLRWEQGALRALDHDDPEGERALAALGGERCACVEVLDAWSRHAGDPRVLVLASRGPTDPLAAHAGWTAQLGTRPRVAAPAMAPPPAPAPRRQFLRLPSRRGASAAAAQAAASASIAASAPAAPAPPAATVRGLPTLPLATQSESELVALLGLGGGVQDRLVATVADAWARRLETGGVDVPVSAARATLHASMQGRLAAVLRPWLGRADIELELELIEAGGTPILTERVGVVRAELPFAWLAEVWSRGLATVMGRFCLAASTEDGSAWRLTTVGPDLGAPAPVVIQRPAS